MEPVNNAEQNEIIRVLKEENAYLRSLLEQAGITIPSGDIRHRIYLIPQESEQIIKPLDVSYADVRRFYDSCENACVFKHGMNRRF